MVTWVHVSCPGEEYRMAQGPLKWDDLRWNTEGEGSILVRCRR